MDASEQSVLGSGPFKRLVVCTDGTWNDFVHGAVTNVMKLARAVKRHDSRGMPQVVYYHAGVGTGTNAVDRVLGGATGWGISANIRDAYNFLVQNYVPGDEIYLFGFSRGAYTARSIAGLIRNAGILRPRYAHKVPAAYDLYRDRDPSTHPDESKSVEFRRAFSYDDTRITCLGVWDTVGALGVPLGGMRYAMKLWGSVTRKPVLYEFHDVRLSAFIDHAYHAVAVHERREAFRPALWPADTKREPGQSFEQAWFPGVHCNVGGGYEGAALSDLALEWMAERVQRHGLELDVAQLDPPLCPRADETPADSQTRMYQVLAVLKKLNASTVKIGLGPDDVDDLRQHVDWWGNYHRPVTGPRIGADPT